jgi:hypothetical protein
LHQAVTVHEGAWYALDAWILHDDPAVASAFLRVSWYASADTSGEALSTDDSTSRLDAPDSHYRSLITGPIQAPPGAHSARVRIMLAPVSEARASLVVDDVGWREVPPPQPTVEPTPTAIAVSGNAASTGPGGSDPQVQQSRAVRLTSIEQQGGDVSASVVVNEVLYDADSDVPDAQAEWIELYNAASAPVDLTGWALRDAATSDTLSGFIIPARGFAIIAASDDFRAVYPDFTGPLLVLDGRIGNGLGNDGDALALVDASGEIIDAVSWGDDSSILDPSVDDVPSGHSIERKSAGVDSNVAGDFIDNERPSPGSPFEALPQDTPPASTGGQLVEVLSGRGSRDWDWLAWAIVAVSVAALAGTAGWRATFAVRDRLRHS